MKVAIITDQHFGARKSSKILHDYYGRFYQDVFFPYLKENNIKTLIDMGDTFDNRRTIDLWAIDWARNNYFNRLQKMGGEVHSLVGNHTAYYKDTNSVNTLDNFLGEYENVHIYSEPPEVPIGGLDILFIPWINAENQETTYKMIEDTTATVAMGHLDLNGFEAHKGFTMTHGIDKNLFSKFGNNCILGRYFYATVAQLVEQRIRNA